MATAEHDNIGLRPDSPVEHPVLNVVYQAALPVTYEINQVIIEQPEEIDRKTRVAMLSAPAIFDTAANVGTVLVASVARQPEGALLFRAGYSAAVHTAREYIGGILQDITRLNSPKNGQST